MAPASRHFRRAFTILRSNSHIIASVHTQLGIPHHQIIHLPILDARGSCQQPTVDSGRCIPTLPEALQDYFPTHTPSFRVPHVQRRKPNLDSSYSVQRTTQTVLGGLLRTPYRFINKAYSLSLQIRGHHALCAQAPPFALTPIVCYSVCGATLAKSIPNVRLWDHYSKLLGFFFLRAPRIPVPPWPLYYQGKWANHQSTWLQW